MAWRQASIVGVGATRQGKLPDETPLSLAAQAFPPKKGDKDCTECHKLDKKEAEAVVKKVVPTGTGSVITVFVASAMPVNSSPTTAVSQARASRAGIADRNSSE